MSMDRHTLQAVLEEQERHRDGVERRREERDAQRDADRTAHMTAMADKMAAMCLAIQNLVVAQAQFFNRYIFNPSSRIGIDP
ncbi:UNVERIFIED_CONTAM: hypothetical protein FKN15_035773 [Acipenser sinensis]